MRDRLWKAGLSTVVGLSLLGAAGLVSPALAQTSPYTIDATPTARAGVSAQSQHYRLISEAPIDAGAIITDLEGFRRAVLADLGLPDRPAAIPLTLNIIDDPTLFEMMSPGGITAAIYLRSPAGNDIVVGYSSTPGHFLSDALEPGWLRLVLRHEVVHHIIDQHYPRKLPIWLGEGLAEYYATYDQDEQGRAVFGRALPEQQELSTTDGWLPMRTVIESMDSYPTYHVVSDERLFRAQRLYYGQSWALANYVLDQPGGLARVHNFVDGWDRRSDAVDNSEDSFERAFGLRYGPLETAMRDRLGEGRTPLRIGAAGGGQRISATSQILGEAEKASNRLRLLLRFGRLSSRVDDRAAILRSQVSNIRDPEILLSNAHRAWRQRDWDASDRFTDAILLRDPAHARALHVRAKTAYGRVSEDQTNDPLWAAAETAAVNALAVSPDNPAIHLFRVAVSLPETERLSAPALASLDWLVADQTHLRLPHEAMMMIPALIYEGRFDRADRVLDNAARWTTDPSERFVIDRLRANVESERERAAILAE